MIKDRIVLSEYGKIVEQQWKWLAQNFPYVELDQFIVMPNHIHGILVIKDLDKLSGKILPLSNIVGAFKTTSSKLIHLAGLLDFAWLKSFYDHVIRKDESLDSVRQYMVNNPKQWEMDKENPMNIKPV